MLTALGSLTTNLFNSDSLIEYIGYKSVSCSNCYTLHLISETGSVIYNFPDTVVGGQSQISRVNGNYKLIYRGVNSRISYVFSLPGTLPCDLCGGINGLVEPNTGGGLGEMKVYPNPFNNTLQVNYDFPTNQSNPRLILTDILGRE